MTDHFGEFEHRCRACPSGHTGPKHDAERAFDALSPGGHASVRGVQASPPPQHPEGGWLDRGGRRWRCYCPEKGPNCIPAEPCEVCEDGADCWTEHNLGAFLGGIDVDALFGRLEQP